MSRFPIARSILALCGAGLLAAAVLTAAQKPSPADLVLTNGRIVTMDPAKPEVRALAVRGDRIEALGTVKEIAAYIGPATQVIDLGGRLATPGLDRRPHAFSPASANPS